MPLPTAVRAVRSSAIRPAFGGIAVDVGGTLTLTTQPSTTATSGTALAQQPVVTLSEVRSGIVVTASLSSGSASLANATAVSDASGVATFSGLALVGADGATRLQFTATNWNTATAAADTTIGSAAASAILSGTASASIVAADIVAGGKTIILTLANDTWVAAGATFNAQRQNIIDGIDSAQAEAGGWDAVVKAGLAVTTVVRTSDTVVTITLSAFASYAITATETITATIPATALSAAGAVVATPTFAVTNYVTPNIINNADFAADYGGLTNASGSGDPNGFTRTTAGDATPVARITLGTGGETAGDMYAFLAINADRVWVRFYYELSAGFDGTLKLMQFFGPAASPNFGGIYFRNGHIDIFFAQEQASNAGIVSANIPGVGSRHYLELDCWRNGDTGSGADLPSYGIWADGVAVTSGGRLFGSPADPTYINGRLTVATRASSAKINRMYFAGTKNADNTVLSDLELTRIAVSTAGRIGP